MDSKMSANIEDHLARAEKFLEKATGYLVGGDMVSSCAQIAQVHIGIATAYELDEIRQLLYELT